VLLILKENAVKRIAMIVVSACLCAASVVLAQGGNPVVVMETSKGNLRIELFQDKAPVTVKNFLQYVDDKFYDGTTFHRVIPNFMIQGGGFTTGMDQKKTRAPIRNEADNGLRNERGTLAMARTGDPNSATAQFFINLKHNVHLDKTRDGAGYAVFGKVLDGMDVVDRISQVPTTPDDVPREVVIILSVRRVTK
jgi:cyclophilin family peptidyl-prolyl cis-trans isomerase